MCKEVKTVSCLFHLLQVFETSLILIMILQTVTISDTKGGCPWPEITQKIKYPQEKGVILLSVL